MTDFRDIAKLIVFDALGTGPSSPANREETRIGDLYPEQPDLDQFISRLQSRLSAYNGDVPDFLRSVSRNETVGGVIDRLAALLPTLSIIVEIEPGVEISESESFGEIRIGEFHSVEGGFHIVGVKIGAVGDIVAGDKNTLEGPENQTWVRVFYATDRRKDIDLRDRISYGATRSDDGKLNYGECTISIPKVHKVGKMESPSILRLEFRPNPKKHIVLAQTISLDQKRFFKNVATSVSRSKAKDAFVFVHGYNVSFEDAARRTGQITFDLSFIGAPIFYSWPSNGHIADYIKDETNVSWSAPHFEHFLSLLAAHSGAARIHIIAHSMGNRIICDALKHIAASPDRAMKFNHLVLAAPDIDADTFRELAATLQMLSVRVTLYESSNDKAILASKRLHGSPRAGEPLLVIPGLDTVDASAISTDFLSHSYFSDNWPLLADIHSILAFDRTPAERFGLAKMTDPRGEYYAFRKA
jgi:esterase/lipase superfamily enzyme